MPATKLTATSSLPQGRCAIPASVIFSSRELKRYKQWQRQTTTIRASQQGYLPTATEYDDFQRWLAKHDSGYFSDVFEDIAAHIQKSDAESTTKSTFPPLPAMGTICRHLLHPGETNYNMPRCPVCTITVHLTYMEVIQKALEAAGGHPPRSRLSTSSEQQENVYQAWCRSKLDTLQELSRLEDLAEKAELWSSEHSTEDIGDVKTSEEALNTYWTRISQPSRSSPPCPTQKSKPKKSKPVAFIEGTDFEPGRPQIYYWRRSPRYDPGKYALAGENDEADTESNPNDSSHDQKAKTSSEKTWSDAMSNVEEGNHEGARYEWEDTSSLGGEESDSDSDGEVEEEEDYVVFEDDDDDEGSFIVFDD